MGSQRNAALVRCMHNVNPAVPLKIGKGYPGIGAAYGWPNPWTGAAGEMRPSRPRPASIASTTALRERRRALRVVQSLPQTVHCAELHVIRVTGRHPPVAEDCIDRLEPLSQRIDMDIQRIGRRPGIVRVLEIASTVPVRSPLRRRSWLSSDPMVASINVATSAA